MKRCKYCQSELSKLHYQNNKKAYKDRSRARKDQILKENKLRLHVYLLAHPCIDCGETDLRLLEFDHISGQKEGEISDLLRQGFNWNTIKTEIAKCTIRCANCHRKQSLERSGSWRTYSYTHQLTRNHQKMYSYLTTHPCVDCGEKDIRLLEFDHVRGIKVDNISRLLTQGYSWSNIETEIAKCDVRCANCHRIKTFQRGGNWWRSLSLE